MQPIQQLSQPEYFDFTTGSPGDQLGTTGHGTQNASTAAQMLAYNPHFNPIPSPPVPFSPTHEHDGHLPDVVMITQDQVQYYVHSRQLMQISATAWGGVFAHTMSPGSVNVSEDASTLRLALYLVYGLPCHHLGPQSLETIEAALTALRRYGVAVDKLSASYMPLYNLVLAHAPYRPIETYALAGRFYLEPVAVAASAHLLAFDTSTLTDALTIKMGAMYFKRLLDLHKTRRTALKAIVLRPPQMHPPMLTCGDGQRELMKICASAAAELAWDSLPILSTYALQSVFEKHATGMRCDACKAVLQQRIQEVTTEWSAVKRTI